MFATSSPLGTAEALEMAARDHSAPQGHSTCGPSYGRSSPRGSAGALEMAARARSVPLGRSKCLLEPARLCLGARKCRSNSLELARLCQAARNGSKFGSPLAFGTWEAGDRRLGGAQPGNRFVSFVSAYARSGCLVELDLKLCGPAFSLFPFAPGFSFVGMGGPGELSLFPFGPKSFPFSLPPPPKPPIQL